MKLKKPPTRPLQDYNACLRCSEYILYEIIELRAWNPPPGQLSQFSQQGQHWLGCLAGGFYALNLGFHKKYILNP